MLKQLMPSLKNSAGCTCPRGDKGLSRLDMTAQSLHGLQTVSWAFRLGRLLETLFCGGVHPATLGHQRQSTLVACS